MSDEITTAIQSNAVAPASVSAGGVTVVAKSLPDQIEAAKFLASQNALLNPATALAGMRAQISPPGGAQ